TVASLLPQQTAEARRKAADARKEVKLSGTAQHRFKVVRWHYEHGGNVTKTADHFSHSRTSIQAWVRTYETHGVAGLEDKSHRPQNVRKPTWTADLERRVLEL